MGIGKVHILGTDKGKCIKPHISLRCNLVIQLTYRATAKVSGVFIFGICISDSFIDALKLRISDDGLTSKNQSSFVWNAKRNVFKYTGIIGDNLTYNSISSCNSLYQFSIFIGKNDGKSI